MNKFLLAAALCLQAAAVSLTGMERPGVVVGEYAMLMRANISDDVHAGFAQRFAGAKKSKIGDSFRAVFAKLSDSELDWVLGQDQIVELVEPNLGRWAHQVCPAVQAAPISWGQSRTTVSSARDVASIFAHDPTWGQGVDVYVVDTGILCSHVEFTGRCTWGTNTIGGTNNDVNGHGTHCAGTVAGTRYGIAKSANLIAVKVLDDRGSGTVQSCVAGYEYAAQQAVTRRRPSVASVSLGGGFSAVENAAVNACVAQGVTFSVAAGNSNRDACSESPASAEACICVGSTELGNQGGQQVDARSSFSNHGSCVDIFAPGSQITSAYIPQTTSYSTLSGTSMACPHVSGVAAALYSKYPTATPAQMKQHIYGMASEGTIANLPANTINRMLHLQC